MPQDVNSPLVLGHAQIHPNSSRGLSCLDGLARSRKMAFSVIPAKAGIQEKQTVLDPGFRRGDGVDDFTKLSALDHWPSGQRSQNSASLGHSCTSKSCRSARWLQDLGYFYACTGGLTC